MKKIILFICCMFFLCGCTKTDEKDIINEINKKIENSKNYQITATLEIYRNEEKFTYDIVSTYKKDNYFKVDLLNKENNHEQMILKDQNSVYVLTPSLNKSFKFQSDWPYNNSQIYLLQPILMDIENDKERNFETTEEGYIITSSVNYSNEKEYKKQKIYIDENNNIKKVEVLSDDNEIKMKLNVINIQYNVDLEDDYFDVDKYINEEKEEELEEEKEESSASLKEIVYPMYVPTDTYLTSQDVINTEDGERVILSFTGESQFTLIQENSVPTSSLGYIYGDPYLILDTVGAITDSSVTWISNGIEYSIMSDTLEIDELLTVAQSIGVEPVGK